MSPETARQASAHLNAALAAEQAGAPNDALSHYQALLQLDPEHPGGLLRVAQSYLGKEENKHALGLLESAVLAAKKRGFGAQSFPIHSARIIALRDAPATRRLSAIASAQEDCGEVPGLIWEECECLLELGQHQRRLHRLNRLAALQPNDPAILAALGLALIGSNSSTQAITPMRNAIALGYNNPEFELSLAGVEIQKGDFAAARSRLDKLRADDPAHFGMLGLRWNLAAQCCDWDALDALEAELSAQIDRGACHGALSPGRMLAGAFSGEQLRAYTLAYAKTLPAPAAVAPLFKSPPPTVGRKIKVGYLSSDFHEHATAILMARLFELHDRSRFEIHAYSYGGRFDDAYQRRLKASFTQWHTLNELSDEDAARMIASHEIDVLVELKGHTYGSRIGIAAYRPAPVQLHYLGFPGTLAAPGIDFFVSDRIATKVEGKRQFSERIEFLPECYQATDDKRFRPLAVSRTELGFENDAIVLCNFNQTWKWRREFVAIWMRALRDAPKARLWLLDPGKDHPAKVAIMAVAATHGVADQIAWAPRTAPNEHLARLATADLALDQLPCNSHTTASDALWVGVPVLTCIGERFDGRVAASLLTTAELPDLVMPDVGAYEAFLRSYLADPSVRESLKIRAANAKNSPLFDSETFARNWEVMIANLAEKAIDA